MQGYKHGDEMTPKKIHVIPANDTYLHEGSLRCWCFPLEKEIGIIIHNAKDCREAKERKGTSTDVWFHVAEY